MMLADCPVCREPLKWTYLLRTMWSQWPCARCGSLLGIDQKRRLLSMFVMVPAIIVAVYLTRSGWPDIVAFPVIILIWLPCFLVLDRAAVIERRGFRCKQCGYDLRGQVAPRCPECGKELDAEERAILETGVVPHAAAARRGRGWIAVVVLSIVFLLTCLAVGVTRYQAVRVQAASRQAVAAAQVAQQAAAGTQPARADGAGVGDESP